MDLDFVLQKHFNIELLNVVLPITFDQRTVIFPDGRKVELPATISLSLFVVERDGLSRACMDAMGNEFRVTG